eukprot:5712123-Amphidinium_carterae.1
MMTTRATSQSNCLRGRHQSITFCHTALETHRHTVQSTSAVQRTSQLNSIRHPMLDNAQLTSISKR